MSSNATRRIHVIGIGAGSPEHVTAEAAAALAEVDVFLVADKGGAKDELVAVRRAICDRFIPTERAYRARHRAGPEAWS
nr:SAM-dependent methyltransferase [Janibacter limosus]